MRTPDPEALLLAIAQGDQSALMELYSAYAQALYGQILRKVERKTLAEAALEDTFLAIWYKAQAYDAGKCRPFTWMLQHAHTAMGAVPSAAALEGYS